MKDEDVIKQITTYIEDDRYCQAVLIDGEWGVGKTFFVKKKLINYLEEKIPQKNIYYISLYGISSSEQIIDAIYSSMLTDIIQEKMSDKTRKKVERGMVCATKLVGAGLKYFNIDFKDLPQLSDVMFLKEAIIIFDDIERCELEINQILGVINDLVEHNDIKVILVANQNEIGRMNFSKDLPQKYWLAVDDRIKLGEQENRKKTYTKEQIIKRIEQLFSEDLFYKKIKEKLVGLTIYYQPDFADVLFVVIDKFVKEDKENAYLKSRKEIIVNIFEEKRHYNIRTLISSLIAFDKFYLVLDKIPFEPYKYIEQEMERVLKYTLISSIRIKSGLELYSWEGSAKFGKVYNKENDIGNIVYGYKFVDDYLLRCNLVETDIVQTILEILNAKKQLDDLHELEESLRYNELSSWWKLEDEEICKILSDMLLELQQQKYKPGYFKDMIITLMQLKGCGFRDISLDQYVNLMAKKLDTCSNEFKSNYLEVLSDDADFKKKYNEIVRPLFEILKKREVSGKKEDNSFLCSQECWNENFRSKCEKYKQEYIKDNKFFYYIEPEKFIQQLQITNVANIYNFLEGVKCVYSFSNLNEFFKSDIPNLKTILEKIDQKELVQEKVTRRMVLEQLKGKLQEYTALIESPICKI